ncbi:MAG: phytoene desaturase family protein [Candidatus Kapabacteria bacterium]|jgi:phytoene desaturase|nr:phytoene desaturase family protein [Candidatus Kapabacteria bacterium]
MKTAAVIGSGFGGLAIAIRLQARGFKVTIFEKNEMLGGHAYQFKEKGYTFDMGPSLITAPEIIERLFEAAGEKSKDYLEYHELNPYYRLYFHDKSHIDYSGDSESMKSQMAKFNKKDAEKYDEFIENSGRIYHEVITKGLGSVPFTNLSTMIKFIPKALQIKAFNSSFKLASNYFEDYRHQFMFSFHPLFIGGNPFRVPAIYLMISYLEKVGGVWYTKGGMYSLVNALQQVFEKQGGKILTNTPVEKIITNDNKVTGVIARGKEYHTDIVVSNADVTHTYGQLIQSDKSKRWSLDRLQHSKYSMGTVVIYLGVKKKYPQLLHHTLILSNRYKNLIDDIFDKNILPDDFSMYLHNPTKTDPSMAPDGCESIYVLVPVTNLSSNISWDEMARPFTNKVINFLEAEFDLVDFRKNIEVERTYTPLDFSRDRNSYLGTPWGMEPVLLQTAYFRPHNKSEDFENLYLVGAGTHPGGGIPGVMLSAEATENCIIKDNK